MSRGGRSGNGTRGHCRAHLEQPSKARGAGGGEYFGAGGICGRGSGEAGAREGGLPGSRGKGRGGPAQGQRAGEGRSAGGAVCIVTDGQQLQTHRANGGPARRAFRDWLGGRALHGQIIQEGQRERGQGPGGAGGRVQVFHLVGAVKDVDPGGGGGGALWGPRDGTPRWVEGPAQGVEGRRATSSGNPSSWPAVKQARQGVWGEDG